MCVFDNNGRLPHGKLLFSSRYIATCVFNPVFLLGAQLLYGRVHNNNKYHNLCCGCVSAMTMKVLRKVLRDWCCSMSSITVENHIKHHYTLQHSYNSQRQFQYLCHVWNVSHGTRLGMAVECPQLSLPATPPLLVTTEHTERLHLTLEVFIQHCAPTISIAQWAGPSLSLYPGGSFL